jgi:hypothetical protein
MQKMIDVFAKHTFGKTASEAIDTNVCVSCGEDVVDFDDPLSQREYQISGLCQKCQNSVFDPSIEED